MLTVVSRKLISLGLYSEVNLMVGCIWFAYSRNCSSFSCPWVQTRNMSSMNLRKSSGFHRNPLRRLVSTLPINKFARLGATRVPIAVPLNWKKSSPLNSKWFMWSIISNNLPILWGGILGSGSRLMCSNTASIPSLFGFVCRGMWCPSCINVYHEGGCPVS